MAKSFIGMNGFNPNEYAKFDNGINVYTCVTSSNNHALTGSGTNIKFVADAPFNSGDTITVNGETVQAQTQDGEPLQDGAWVQGATVVCFLNGTTLNFKGGGGAVSVEGLSADVVLSSKTINIKSGNKIIDTVIGSLLPNAFYISTTQGDVTRCGNGDASRSFTKPNDELTITVFTALPITLDDYFGFAVFGKTETSVTNAAPSQYQGLLYSVEVDGKTFYVYDALKMARSDKPTITKASGGNVDLSVAFYATRSYPPPEKIDSNTDLLKMIKALLY